MEGQLRKWAVAPKIEYRPRSCMGCDWGAIGVVLIRSATHILVWSPSYRHWNGRGMPRATNPPELTLFRCPPTYDNRTELICGGTFKKMIETTLPLIRRTFCLQIDAKDITRERTLYAGKIASIEHIWPQGRVRPPAVKKSRRKQTVAQETEAAARANAVYFVTHVQTRVVRYAVTGQASADEAIALIDKLGVTADSWACVHRLGQHLVDGTKMADRMTHEEWLKHPENPRIQERRFQQ